MLRGLKLADFVGLVIFLGSILILNAYCFIKPAVITATGLAVRSLAQGQLMPEYRNCIHARGHFWSS